MTNNNPDFYFPPPPPSPSSSSVPLPLHHHQKMRKTRSKLIKMEPTCSNSSACNIIRTPKIQRYAKKPDPCSECGKKFWSWKALFGHMRCHPERQWRGLNPPPNHRKSPLVGMMSAEDHEVAACLLLLSSGSKSSTILESKCGGDGGGATCSSNFHVEKDGSSCSFECSSCKKVFGSHQALGGHRATHKNVKGCFAITKTSSTEIVCNVKENLEENVTNNNNKLMLKGVLGHKCTRTSLKVFSSGQPLGGHKRCHWQKDEVVSSMNHQLIRFNNNTNNNVFVSKENCRLDLNLMPPVEDESSSFSLGLTLDLRLGL